MCIRDRAESEEADAVGAEEAEAEEAEEAEAVEPAEEAEAVEPAEEAAAEEEAAVEDVGADAPGEHEALSEGPDAIEEAAAEATVRETDAAVAVAEAEGEEAVAEAEEAVVAGQEEAVAVEEDEEAEDVVEDTAAEEEAAAGERATGAGDEEARQQGALAEAGLGSMRERVLTGASLQQYAQQAAAEEEAGGKAEEEDGALRDHAGTVPGEEDTTQGLDPSPEQTERGSHQWDDASVPQENVRARAIVERHQQAAVQIQSQVRRRQACSEVDGKRQQRLQQLLTPRGRPEAIRVEAEMDWHDGSGPMSPIMAQLNSKLDSVRAQIDDCQEQILRALSVLDENSLTTVTDLNQKVEMLVKIEQQLSIAVQHRTNMETDATESSSPTQTCFPSPSEHPVSYTHLRAHETPEHLVCRLLLEKKKKK
eukprot:TRINITY_DN14440_c0_g1_i1.p1 TRINITY_DN14440_c0_g1~~TRINITY_DN14440_c0_g1_i1.p1  ORF type:complete len:423 (-),score=183.67 TRINITY_DN14440_c0_g1_i1:52-1320(-)